MKGKVHQINVGAGGVPKYPVLEAYVSRERVIGDDWSWGSDKIQKNGKTGKHGGAGKAVCLYSLECLERLKEFGFAVFPGALGENFTTAELDYRAVKLGDVYQVGAEVQIRITKIRAPCGTIAEAYGKDITNAMWDEKVKKCDYAAPKWGMTGFYAEVFQTGRVRPSDIMERIFEGDADLPLGKWRDYKGSEYDVLDIALDTEMNPPGSTVVYRARSDSEFGPKRVLISSKKTFLEKIVVDGKEIPRFTFVD